MRKRWRASRRWLVLGACVLLGACGDTGGGGGASPLRVAIATLPPSLGNPYVANGTPSTLVWYALFDALTQIDDQGVLQPALATSWRALDEHTWRFELRRDVRFSNGRQFDAQAVVDVLAWLRSEPGRRSVIGNELKGVVDARAAGEYAVEIQTATPDAILPRRLCSVMMVEPDLWRALGPEAFARVPVGTGAYRLATWGDEQQRARVVANPDSWRAPLIDELVFVVSPDRAVRIQALIAGEVDLVPASIGPGDYGRLADAGFNTLVTAALGVTSLAFRTVREDDSPLKDRRVRQALNYAVDKAAIATHIMQGLVVPAGQPAPRPTPGYNEDVKPYPYDPQRARELLSEAGYPQGFALSIGVVHGFAPGDAETFQTVVQHWREVGVEATITSLTFAAWLRNYLSGTWDVDAFGLTWNAAPYNDPQRPMEYFSCAKSKPFFCDPELAERVAATGREFDEQERIAMLKSLAQAYHDSAPALFLYEQTLLSASRPTVQGLALANRVPVYEKLRLVDR